MAPGRRGISHHPTYLVFVTMPADQKTKRLVSPQISDAFQKHREMAIQLPSVAIWSVTVGGWIEDDQLVA